MGNVLNPLAKIVLKPVALTATALTKEAAIRKKMVVSGFTTLLISDAEIEGFMKIVS